MKNQKILLANRHLEELRGFQSSLTNEGFEVYCTNKTTELIQQVNTYSPQVIILDVKLPALHAGSELINLISTPELKSKIILLLANKEEENEAVLGLDAGAADFIYKSTRPRLLLYKIQSLLKRLGKNESPNNNNYWVIDKDRYIVKKGNKEIPLLKREFQLLSLLNTHPGQVFSREIINKTIWPNQPSIQTRNLDVHVSHLRDKVGKEHLLTVKGVGYKWLPGG